MLERKQTRDARERHERDGVTEERLEERWCEIRPESGLNRPLFWSKFDARSGSIDLKLTTCRVLVFDAEQPKAKDGSEQLPMGHMVRFIWLAFLLTARGFADFWGAGGGVGDVSTDG